MITGFDSNEVFEIVMDGDTENKTSFFVSGLTVRVKQKAILNYDKDPVEGMFLIVRTCLKKIKNYKVGKNAPVDVDVVTDEVVDSLPIDVFQFLSNKIISLSSMTGQEAKN